MNTNNLMIFVLYKILLKLSEFEKLQFLASFHKILTLLFNQDHK